MITNMLRVHQHTPSMLLFKSPWGAGPLSPPSFYSSSTNQTMSLQFFFFLFWFIWSIYNAADSKAAGPSPLWLWSSSDNQWFQHTQGFLQVSVWAESVIAPERGKRTHFVWTSHAENQTPQRQQLDLNLWALKARSIKKEPRPQPHPTPLGWLWTPTTSRSGNKSNI